MAMSFLFQSSTLTKQKKKWTAISLNTKFSSFRVQKRKKRRPTWVSITLPASSLTAKERSIIPNSKTYALMIFVSKTHVPTLVDWSIYPM
ncbi:hypothetical protein DW888_09320 [Bacteroides nordii]|uniref:Uncharacterized protein n=1 Tax=Bacteroides nordii TaxID=291645 RepID=A0A413VR31_9BACE|nr:hypothetical protein DW888_09320 [Bacteroides nordii]